MLKPNAALKSVGTLGSGNWLETTATTVRQSATGGATFQQPVVISTAAAGLLRFKCDAWNY